MAHIVFDLQREFQNVFGGRPYTIQEQPTVQDAISGYQLGTTRENEQFTGKGGQLFEMINGIEIWLPVKLYAAEFPQGGISLPYSVVRVSSKKNIVRTKLNDRRGSVKEQFSIDDYNIDLRGFLINHDRRFPEAELEMLKKLYETTAAIDLSNALTDIFLINQGMEKDKVVIVDMDLPQVEGGRKHLRPFSISLETDSIFTLEIDD